MFNDLVELKKNSYSNISKFSTASIVKMKDGVLFQGVNVENPSFKDGLCSEQVAIGTAIAEGYTKGDFDTLYLLGSAKHSSTPCFLCRQVLVELFDMESKIIVYNEEGKEKIYKVKDLCPHIFGSGDLYDK